MAILIFLKGCGGNALVSKGKIKDVEVSLQSMRPGFVGNLASETKNTFLMLDGFDDISGRMIIMNPFENVTHFLEQPDKLVRENKKKAEERQKAAERQMKDGSSLVDPVNMFPGRKNN